MKEMMIVGMPIWIVTGQARADQAGDGLVRALERDAEIAVQHGPDVAHILLGDRLVEAVLVQLRLPGRFRASGARRYRRGRPGTACIRRNAMNETTSSTNIRLIRRPMMYRATESGPCGFGFEVALSLARGLAMPECTAGGARRVTSYRESG